MDTALIVGILTASVTALGWLVTNILSTSAERRRQSLLAQLEFTKRQLEELYGPLAFLVLEGQQSFRDLIATLGRNFIFVEGYDLPENELSLWLFWVENDFFPRKERWPREFNKEILATFEILKQRHSILIGKVSEGNYLLPFSKGTEHKLS